MHPRALSGPLGEARGRAHAVIAGTGRAGTTFLVEFLGACGLSVGDALDDDSYFTRARAGREHALDSGDDLPYVVKDPWFFAYCGDVDLDITKIDALIVPVRDLGATSRSRVHQERLEIVSQPSWTDREGVGVFGHTPGGILYSVDAGDQARLLAVGFHDLVHWALSNDVPLFLLDFPRLVNDGEYLVEALAPWLLEHCTRDEALGAHALRAHPERVRFTPEPDEGAAPEVLARLRAERRALAARVQELQAQNDARAQENSAALSDAHAELRAMQHVVADLEQRVAIVHGQLHGMSTSLSWRVTRPLRWLRARVGRQPDR